MAYKAEWIIDICQKIVNDDGTKWGGSWFSFINSGQLLIADIYPSATATTETVTLDPGVLQECPDGSLGLLKVTHNMVTRAGSALQNDGILIEPQKTNKFLYSETPATQDVTVTAQSHNISFVGTGTITLSGAHAHTVTGIGADERVNYTFLASSGTLTCTVSGDVQAVDLIVGTFPTSHIVTEAAEVARPAAYMSNNGFPSSGPWAAAITFVNEMPLSGITSSALFGSYTDSDNYFSVNIGPAGVTPFRKSQGTLTSPSFAYNFIGGEEYTVIARLNDDDTMSLFVDGELIGTTTETTPIEVATSGVFQVGANGNGATGLYGTVKAFEVFEEELTDAECAVLVPTVSMGPPLPDGYTFSRASECRTVDYQGTEVVLTNDLPAYPGLRWISASNEWSVTMPDRIERGAAITLCDEEFLTAAVPGWTEAPVSATIENYMFDENEPTKFKVYPPASDQQTVQVAVQHVAEITECSKGSDLLSVADKYAPALAEWCLYMAYSGETDAADPNKANARLQNFFNLLGIKAENRVKYSPNVQQRAGFPPAEVRG